LDEGKANCHIAVNMLQLDDRLLTPALIASLNQVAAALLALGEQALAEQLLEYGYEIGRGHPEHPDAPLLLDTYAGLLEDSGRVSEIADLRHWFRPVLTHRLLTSA